MTDSTAQDTTTTAPAAGDSPLSARAERMLREHAVRAEHQLRELESDMAGLLTDASTIQEDRDGTRRLVESIRSDLMRTQRALERIASGTYGLCVACKSPIAPERLEAIPESERCSRCA